MIGRLVLAALLGLGLSAAATAQLPRLPVPVPRRGQPPPPPTIDMLRLDFAAASGSDTVYFAGSSHGLDAAARATLAAQARWLLMRPFIIVRVEGHADEGTPRDQAIGLGERRADAVRDFLVLQGVPAAQLQVMSWGKERPRVEGSTEAARALNRRVTTVLLPYAA
jgi:peptidoglycan-associated lipoprotein